MDINTNANEYMITEAGMKYKRCIGVVTSIEYRISNSQLKMYTINLLRVVNFASL